MKLNGYKGTITPGQGWLYKDGKTDYALLIPADASEAERFAAQELTWIFSIAGVEVYPNGNVYCASKHAVTAITKAMRMDLLPYGIRVGSISPGAAETEFSIVRFKGDEEKAKAVYKGLTPLNAEDIADVVEFMVTRPAHVMINDVLLTPARQANTYVYNRTV